MDELLHRATNILVLGCGGGNLATRLARLGKELTIVDNNPVSFVIAQRYFGLPDGLPLMVSDFRKFILDDDLLYDGIAIDVGGPDFRFDDEFDVGTCDAIRARLTPSGRIVMNVLVANEPIASPRGWPATGWERGLSTNRVSRIEMRSLHACRKSN